jgi:hypothetical protein
MIPIWLAMFAAGPRKELSPAHLGIIGLFLVALVLCTTFRQNFRAVYFWGLLLFGFLSVPLTILYNRSHRRASSPTPAQAVQPAPSKPPSR